MTRITTPDHPHRALLGEAARFVVVGGIATAVHYGIYYLLLSCIYANVAYATGYVLSFIANFVLTSYFTFGTAPSVRKLAGFSGAHVVNFVLHMVLLNVFLMVGVPKALAPLPVFAIAIPVNFMLVRLAFKGRRKRRH